MSRYLITLTPIDKYFFGGEITFTRSKREHVDKQSKDMKEEEQEDKDLKSFDENFSSYVVRSNQFPQQTSLLGMLRFAFLSNDETLFDGQKIIAKKEKDVKGLIGEESFSVNGDGVFGAIKSISPCFIQRSTDNWETRIDLLIAPMDHNLSVTFEEGKVFLDNKKGKIPQIKGYKAKDGLKSYCLGNKVELKMEGLFTEDTRIGIDRDFEGKTESGAFYKQISFRLSDKYKIKEGKEEKEEKHQLCFAFYADLDKALPNQIVSLGGDNSKFKLTCTINNSNTELVCPEGYNKNNFENCHGKVVLLSHALIDQKAMDNCLFSINEVIPFRFLQSAVKETTEYYKFSGTTKHLKRSDKKYNLYKQGSVFYFDTKKEMEEFISALESKTRFRQIGYNHFEEFPKLSKNNN